MEKEKKQKIRFSTVAGVALVCVIATALALLTRTETLALSHQAEVSIVKIDGMDCLLITAPPDNYLATSMTFKWGYDERKQELWVIRQRALWSPIDRSPAEMNYPIVISLHNLKLLNESWGKRISVTTQGRALGAFETNPVRWIPAMDEPGRD